MERKSEPGVADWIDPDDAPELDDEWFDTAVWEINGVRIPTPPTRNPDVSKVEVRFHVDADVADFFRTSEPGWERRINLVLRSIAGQA